ncbi:uncharacterized protein LOC136067725 [Quercus suber]|uniref:uncharacterized protein LOC136067725 n=1 Tax=Quercus suber TaxID=58331 RepID=UPI0032DF0A10
MVGNPERHNHNLYCHYHQDHRHTTEDCRSLWDHLDQLIREGKLKQLLHLSNGRGGQMNPEPRRDDVSRPPLGTINVIFATPGRIGSWPSRVMSVARLPTGDFNPDLKRAKVSTPPVLGFSDEDKIGTIQPHDDTLVITLRIGGYDVKRVMVDKGNATEIMYPDLYKGLNLKPDDLTPYSSHLVSFKRRVVIPKGQIRLPVQTGAEVIEVDFIVMDSYLPYTAIVARPWLHMLGVVSSILHQKVKYPSEAEVARYEELIKIAIGDDSEKFFQVGSQLPLQEKEELVEFLNRNIDVFSWNAYNAPGVDPEFICHHLKVNPLITLKKQPSRRPFKEHADAVREEVAKLKQLVDATVGHPRMSFLDAFQGYHQIPLALDDQEKTAFVTPIGNYHYKVMPFDLKNAGSTYQRMLTRMFEPQLGKSIEIYIDDMVVKSKIVSEHVRDLGNIFEVLRKYKLCLNASKCSFGIGSGKFLGYMVTHRGIEVNPD